MMRPIRPSRQIDEVEGVAEAWAPYNASAAGNVTRIRLRVERADHGIARGHQGPDHVFTSGHSIAHGTEVIAAVPW